MIRDGKGDSRRFCFVVFKDAPTQQAALHASGHVIRGKIVTVKQATTKFVKVKPYYTLMPMLVPGLSSR